jgi:hypothetical protein
MAILFCLFVCLFQTGSHYIAQAGLELTILLPQSLQCWHYSSALPHLLLAITIHSNNYMSHFQLWKKHGSKCFPSYVAKIKKEL